MKQRESFGKWVGGMAVIAGILAILSLVIGLSGVDYDFEVFSDTSSLIGIGADAGNLIKWSFWLNMFGNYLLLMPLALYLYGWLSKDNIEFARLYTLGGLLYLLLGAMGSAILASATPFLIGLYETAGAAQQESLLIQLQVVNAIAEEGLHGIVQNVGAIIWFLGMGALMRPKRNLLGLAMMGVGLFLVANTIGNLFNVEALSLLGLTGNILLAPLWSVWIGVLLWRRQM